MTRYDKQALKFCKSDFSIGEMVQVINWGDRYSMYREWIELYCPSYLKYWNLPDPYSRELIYKVRCIAPHSYGRTILLIQSVQTDNIYIIGERGVKKYDEIR